jgi:hypothetical protein
MGIWGVSQPPKIQVPISASSLLTKCHTKNSQILPFEDAVRSRPIVWILCACLFAVLCLAQANNPRHVPNTDVNSPPADEQEARSRLEHDLAKKANEERHAALRTDAEKLLKLSVELKAYVDKSNENVLSLDVIKKAEEIEKLAHSVKAKMKGPN